MPVLSHESETSCICVRGIDFVTRSLVLCVCSVDGFLYFCPFSFGHCVVCSSSIYNTHFLLYIELNLFPSGI